LTDNEEGVIKINTLKYIITEIYNEELDRIYW